MGSGRGGRSRRGLGIGRSVGITRTRLRSSGNIEAVAKCGCILRKGYEETEVLTVSRSKHGLGRIRTSTSSHYDV